MPKIITDEELKELLRSKKFETPSESEWMRFDRSFDDKLLAAVKLSWTEKLMDSMASVFILKPIRVAFAGMACFLLTLVFSKQHFKTVSLDAGMARQIGNEYVQYVSDRMLADCSGGYTDLGACCLSYSYDGVEYVSDMLEADKSLNLLAKM